MDASTWRAVPPGMTGDKTVALIRHNTRAGDRQPGNFAHDTTRRDVSGAWCSGKTEKVYTSRSNPCPMCGGWGELVEIDQLPRNTHPQGSRVEPYSLKVDYDQYTPGPLDGTWEGGEGADVEPTIEGAWDEQGTPVELAPSDAPDYPVPYPAPVIPPMVDSVPVSVPADPKVADAGKAIADLLGIQGQIEDAIATVKADVREETQTTVAAGIAILEENFKQAVESIIAPTLMHIEHEGKETIEIKGTHNSFQKCLQWLLARDHEGMPRNLFLTGPAGSGKTTLARQLAKALDVTFYTTGQVLSEHQIMGFVDGGGNYHGTPFHAASVNGGLWLGDEYDAWSPEASLAMNAALANGHATFPDSPETVARHQDCYYIVAGNTWGKGADREYVGRNQMDAASLSRFVIIHIDYDRALETQLAGEYQEWLHMVWTARDRARELKIRETFGTRELMHGVAGLNAGIGYDDVVSTVLKRNMTDAEWRKIAVAA